MVQALSPGHLFATQWTVAPQAPLSMGFSRQEYWSGLPFPPPGDRPNPGIEPSRSLTSPALAGGFFTTAPHGSQLKGRPRLGFCPRRWLPVSPPRFSLYTICLIVIASSLSFFFFFFLILLRFLPCHWESLDSAGSLIWNPGRSSSLSQWAQLCPHPHTLESFDF